MMSPSAALLLVAMAGSRPDPEVGLDWARFFAPGCLPGASAKVGDAYFFAVSCDVGAEKMAGLYRVLARGKKLERLLEGDGGIDFVALGGLLIFSRYTEATGHELWRSDGTTTGTRLIKDIWPGPVGSNAVRHLVRAGRLFFQANDPEHGAELWVTDGSEAGTRLVKDTWPGPTGGQPVLYPGGDALLYLATIGVGDGAFYWRSDGTTEGTVVVHEYHPRKGPTGSWADPGPDAELYRWWEGGFHFYREARGPFTLMTKAPPPAPWRVVKQLGALDGITGRVEHEGRLYFGTPIPGGNDLWVSDGTTEGTRVLAQLHCLDKCERPTLHAWVSCGRPMFVLEDHKAGHVAFSTDGTAQGTRRLVSGRYVNGQGCVGRTSFLWVQVPAPEVRVALYATDGTSEGTWKVWEQGDVMASPSSADSAIYAQFIEDFLKCVTALKDKYPELENLSSLEYSREDLFFQVKLHEEVVRQKKNKHGQPLGTLREPGLMRVSFDDGTGAAILNPSGKKIRGLEHLGQVKLGISSSNRALIEELRTCFATVLNKYAAP